MTTPPSMIRALLAGAMIALVPVLAAAQRVADFSELPGRVAPGERIQVKDVDGRVWRGTLVSLSRSSLIITAGDQSLRLDAEHVREVSRAGDRLLNGMLIGFGAGAAVAVGVAVDEATHESWFDYPPGDVLVWGLVVFGGIGAGAGAGIDALIKGYTPVYRSPVRFTAAPLLRKGTYGAAASFRW